MTLELAGKILFFLMLAWVVPLTLFMMYDTTLDVIAEIKRRWRDWREPV